MASSSDMQALPINTKSPPGPFQTAIQPHEPAGHKRPKRAHLTNVAPLQRLPIPGEYQQSAGTTGPAHCDDDMLLDDDDSRYDIGRDENLVEVTDIVEVEEDEPDGLPVPKGAKRLSDDEVVYVINEQIEHYTEQWRPGKGHDRTYQTDPVRRWRAAEDAGDRIKRRDIHDADVRDFEYRLDSLCKRLSEEDWSTREDLRRMCRTLEGTVELLEESKWLAGIYALDEADDSDDPDDSSVQDPDDGSLRDLEDAATGIGESSTNVPRQTTEIIDLGSESEPEPESDIEIIGTQRAGAPPVTLAQATQCVDTSGASTRRGSVGQEVINSIWTGADPESASIHAIAQWDINKLVAQRDRKRIIMKILHDMSDKDQEVIRKRVTTVKKRDLLMEILPCVDMFIQGGEKIKGVLQKDTYKVIAFTKLFCCWWLAEDYFQGMPGKQHLQELSDSVRAGEVDLNIFYDWVVYVLANTLREEALRQPPRPSQAEIIVISDDDN